MVLKGGKWVRHAKAKSPDHAKRWAAALNAAVTAKEKKRKRRKKQKAVKRTRRKVKRR